MTNFLGEYEIAIDAKGRFLLPAGFRKQLADGEGERFIVNRGFEGCLTMYPMKVWNALAEKINKLNDFNQSARDFKRLFLNGATMVDVDTAGRILIPKPLMEFSSIKKDMVFSAQGNKIELWDKDTYYNYMKNKAADYSKLASELAGDNFNPFESL